MVRLVIAWLAQSALFASLILGPSWAFSGTPYWPRGLAVLGLLTAVSALGAVWVQVTDPRLAQARASPSPPKTAADAWATALIAWAVTGWFVLAAYDIHRLHLPTAPDPGAMIAGVAIFTAALGLILVTFRANTFATAVVELQPGRSQEVIQHGPYRHVRHPMYLGAILFFTGLGLILGSAAASLAAVPGFALAFMPRVLVEEAALRRELPGYGDYQAKVRFRLLPGVF